MAEKGLTVRLKTDNSGFKKGMDEVIAELEKYNKALVDNQYSHHSISVVFMGSYLGILLILRIYSSTSCSFFAFFFIVYLQNVIYSGNTP